MTSPTFTIGHLYAGRDLEVAHVDLFRLGPLAGEEPGLLEDYLTPDRIAFVEWPGEVEPVLEGPVRHVRVEHAGGDRRALEIEPAARGGHG